MKKMIKFVFKLAIWLVVIALALVLTIPLWFGPVVRSVANAVVPGKIDAAFNIGHLSLNPYTGRFELGELTVANPNGHTYSEKLAVSVGTVAFDLGMSTLPDDVVHIEEITIADVGIALVKDEAGVLNFDQLQYNVAGGREKFETAQAEQAKARAAQEPRPAEAKPQPEKKPEAAQPAQEKPAKEKKFVIDRLSLTGLKIKIGMVPIMLPPLVLNDIGKKSNGATLEDVYDQVVAAVMQSIGAIGDGAKALTEFALSGASQAAEQANQAARQAAEQASQAARQATERLSGAAGKATESVSGAAGKAAESVSGAADTATKAVSGVLDGATDGANKALESFKKLW